MKLRVIDTPFKIDGTPCVIQQIVIETHTVFAQEFALSLRQIYDSPFEDFTAVVSHVASGFKVELDIPTMGLFQYWTDLLEGNLCRIGESKVTEKIHEAIATNVANGLALKGIYWVETGAVTEGGEEE